MVKALNKAAEKIPPPWFDIANYTRFSIFRQCPLKCLLLFFSKIYTKKNFTPKSGSARQPSIFVCY